MLHFSSLNKAMIHQSPVTGDFARSLHPYPARFGCCDQKRKNVFHFLVVTFLHAIYATSIGPNKHTHIAEQNPLSGISLVRPITAAPNPVPSWVTNLTARVKCHHRSTTFLPETRNKKCIRNASVARRIDGIDAPGRC